MFSALGVGISTALCLLLRAGAADADVRTLTLSPHSFDATSGLLQLDARLSFAVQLESRMLLALRCAVGASRGRGSAAGTPYVPVLPGDVTLLTDRRTCCVPAPRRPLPLRPAVCLTEGRARRSQPSWAPGTAVDVTAPAHSARRHWTRPAASRCSSCRLTAAPGAQESHAAVGCMRALRIAHAPCIVRRDHRSTHSLPPMSPPTQQVQRPHAGLVGQRDTSGASFQRVRCDGGAIESLRWTDNTLPPPSSSHAGRCRSRSRWHRWRWLLAPSSR